MRVRATLHVGDWLRSLLDHRRYRRWRDCLGCSLGRNLSLPLQGLRSELELIRVSPHGVGHAIVGELISALAFGSSWGGSVDYPGIVLLWGRGQTLDESIDPVIELVHHHLSKLIEVFPESGIERRKWRVGHVFRESR